MSSREKIGPIHPNILPVGFGPEIVFWGRKRIHNPAGFETL